MPDLRVFNTGACDGRPGGESHKSGAVTGSVDGHGEVCSETVLDSVDDLCD